METVEVVLRIPKKTYNALTHTEFDAKLVVDEMRKSITNGTVLPKGHGRLIDADKYKFDNEDGFCIGFGNDAMNVFKRSVDNAPTVIEADKEVSE